ncbi:MAG: phosphoethanolamine--lipid A transferase [Gammaproteobacteria bacterium]|nr:phosphoethanolamine--lipid A transferase [Gammaproteobacteria bacterium]
MLSLPRWPMAPERVVLLLALWLSLSGNGALMAAAGRVLRPWSWPNLLIAFALAAMVLGSHVLLLGLLAWPRLFRPAATLLLLATAGSGYFMQAYGVIIDTEMIRNLLETDPAEAGELLSPPLLAHLALFGLLPSLLLWRVTPCRRPWRQTLRRRLVLLVGSLLGMAAVLALGYPQLAPFVRNHRELRQLVNPAYPVYSALLYGLAKPGGTAPVVLPVAKTHQARPAAEQARAPRLLVLVVGETARADHFGLNGYARATTPELEALDVLNFPRVQSCGTATAQSLPCMFSNLGHAAFSVNAAAERENLLDLLHEAGLEVLWRDNNSGCKGVCARVPHEKARRGGDAALCPDNECFDEILLQDLEAWLAKSPERDHVLVLHQKGSHGPAYFRRYPKTYAVFADACQDESLASCSPAQVSAAYDNSLRYTDHVLASAIRRLQAQSHYAAALVYVADHGESLGENGIYLHGLPYALAPDAQTHVPMLAWFSPGFLRQTGMHPGCLRQASQGPLSHDNVFALSLGLMDVQSDAALPAPDPLRACRPASPSLAGG